MDSSEIDLKSALAIIFRHRRLIAFCTLVTLVAALGYALLATPFYQSTALLMVDGRGSNLLDAGNGSVEQSAVLNSRVDSEVEIIRSDSNLVAVIEAAGLLTDPEYGPRLSAMDKMMVALGWDAENGGVGRLVGIGGSEEAANAGAAHLNATLAHLRGNLVIRRQGLTYLIAIQVKSESPERAARIANTIAQVYIERQIAAKTRSTVEAANVLRRTIETARQDLAASDAAVDTYVETNLARLEEASGDPAVAALRLELQGAQTRLADERRRVASAEAAAEGGDWASVARSLEDEALAELARQRESLRAQLSGLDPASEGANSLNDRLSQLETEVRRASEASFASARQQINEFSQVEAESQTALRRTLLESDIPTEVLADLFDLQQNASIAREQYQTLLAREKDFGTLTSLQVADARVVSEALPSQNSVEPKRKLIMAIALGFGLAAGLALAFIKEFYVGGVSSAGQLANILQSRVPVTIPNVEVPRNGIISDTILTAPMSIYSEEFRKLRAAIDGHFDRQGGERRGRVVLIASALPAEGKTSAAISLARTYAAAGVRTLLIDADLRKPAVGDRLGVKSEFGMLEYLSHDKDQHNYQLVPAKDPLSELFVLTASGRSSRPTDQLVNSEALRKLIDVAVGVFDVIFIDSPPVLALVDTRYLARFADAIVHVVRNGTTTQGEVREAAALLHESLRPNAGYFGLLSHEERGARWYGYQRTNYYYSDQS